VSDTRATSGCRFPRPPTAWHSVPDEERAAEPQGLLALACVALAAVRAGIAFAVSRDEQMCTLIGGIDGVTVELGAEHRRADRVTACVAGRCNQLDRRASAVEFDIPADGPRSVSVLLVAERDGKPADVPSGAVRLERSEPNGPGCGTWWNARVRSTTLQPASRNPAGQYIG
jgi:hypothetical protein